MSTDGTTTTTEPVTSTSEGTLGNVDASETEA